MPAGTKTITITFVGTVDALRSSIFSFLPGVSLGTSDTASRTGAGAMNVDLVGTRTPNIMLALAVGDSIAVGTLTISEGSGKVLVIDSGIVGAGTNDGRAAIYRIQNVLNADAFAFSFTTIGAGAGVGLEMMV